jgi:hypothetical protein
MMARIETTAAYLLFGLGTTLLLGSNLIVPQNAFADSGCGCTMCDSLCDPTQGGNPSSGACTSCIASSSCCNEAPNCVMTTDDCYLAIGGVACPGNTTCDSTCVASTAVAPPCSFAPGACSPLTTGCFFCLCTNSGTLLVPSCNCL